MDRLAEYYIDPGRQYPMRDVPDRVVLHVTVDRIYGQSPLGSVRRRPRRSRCGQRNSSSGTRSRDRSRSIVARHAVSSAAVVARR